MVLFIKISFVVIASQKHPIADRRGLPLDFSPTNYKQEESLALIFNHVSILLKTKNSFNPV